MEKHHSYKKKHVKPLEIFSFENTEINIFSIKVTVLSDIFLQKNTKLIFHQSYAAVQRENQISPKIRFSSNSLKFFIKVRAPYFEIFSFENTNSILQTLGILSFDNTKVKASERLAKTSPSKLWGKKPVSKA